MLRYIVRRLVWTIVVLWAIVTLTFCVTLLSPVDPVRSYVGLRATPEEYQRVRQQFGLDQPPYVQYVRYIELLLQGNLGTSFINQQPVLDNLAQRLPYTALLAVAGEFVQLAIGIPLGLLAALRRRSAVDRGILFGSLAGVITPTFVLGFVLLYVFSFILGWFPLGGSASLPALVLPALALGLPGAAWYVRMLRSETLNILSSDYVRLARAKGLPERIVISRHILRNALAPIVTMVGLDFGVFFGGVLIVEKVFAWPGIGQQAWLAINQNDQPLVIGTVLCAAFFVTIFNLLADIANAIIDPRAKYA
jgi:peptide/nickel transport system permease protein